MILLIALHYRNRVKLSHCGRFDPTSTLPNLSYHGRSFLDVINVENEQRKKERAWFAKEKGAEGSRKKRIGSKRMGQSRERNHAATGPKIQNMETCKVLNEIDQNLHDNSNMVGKTEKAPRGIYVALHYNFTLL